MTLTKEDLMAITDVIMQAMTERFVGVEARLDKMEERQDRMEEILLNDVVPRLQNIEACYLSTYNRYVEKNEKIDQIEMDVSVLKKIVHEHTLILDKIS